MRNSVRWAVAALALGASATVGSAQSRTELLRQATAAYDDFDSPRAQRLTRTALDPKLGALDSTWVRAAHLMTQLLVEESQTAQARAWARWAVRQMPSMPLDSVNYLSSAVAMLKNARDSVRVTSADAATTETYTWPSATSTDTEARFRVAAGPGSPSIVITGVGVVAAGATRALPAGTYDLDVSATGFLPLKVTREALPGVTVEFAFELTSAAAAANTLAADVSARVRRSIVPLNVTRFGASGATCAIGVRVPGRNLLLTSYRAVRGAESVASGTATDTVRIAAYDARADLAVLAVSGNVSADTLTITSDVADGQSLFGFGSTDCRAITETRVGLASWSNRPSGAMRLTGAPANAATGTAFVDYLGRVAAVWGGDSTAQAGAAADALVSQARINLAGNRLETALAVATREQHRFGSAVISTDVAQGATLRVEPLEAWHLPSDAAAGTGTMTFRGPAGRYRVTASAPNLTPKTQEITIRAGQQSRVQVLLSGAAVPVASARSGRRKWWLIGGAAAVAVGAAAALGGGGGGSNTGSIPVTVTF